MPRNNSYNKSEYIEKQRLSHLKEKNGMYGKKRSNELLEKMQIGRSKFKNFRHLMKSFDAAILQNAAKLKEENRIMKKAFIRLDKICNSYLPAFYWLHKPRQNRGRKLTWKPHNVPHSEEAKAKMSVKTLGRRLTPEWKENIRQYSLKFWSNSGEREKRLKQILHLSFPTSFEKIVIVIINENLLNYKYTGDGTFWIKNKNPDFINEKNKTVIEVFYSWFKIRDYGSVENYKEFCKQKYDSAGWNVIFIDETDLNRSDFKGHILNLISTKSKGL